MKTRPLSSVAKIIGLASLLILIVTITDGLIRADGVIPTNVWTSALLQKEDNHDNL
ncbi:MAG: hypothetical protein ACE5LU_21790 [Anaerolineae bacterium]